MRNGRIKYFSILGVVLFLYLTTSVYSLLICTYILLILPILSLVISLPGMRHVDVEKTHEHFIAKRNHLAYLHFKRVPYKYYPYYSYDGETFKLDSYSKGQSSSRHTNVKIGVSSSDLLNASGDYTTPQYDQFVEENYLGVSQDIKNQLLNLLNRSGYHEEMTIYEKVTLVKNLLASQCVYTLHPGSCPSDQDPVLYFLLENKKGYCMHFASSAALLLRTINIPARYTTGFVLDESDFKGGNVAAVTQAKAHAWVEVYVKGVGWVMIEATPGSGGSSGSDPMDEPAAGKAEETNQQNIEEQTQSPEEKKETRSVFIGAKVTPSQKEYIKSQAEQCGMTVSDYLLACAYNYRPRPRLSKEETDLLQNLDNCRSDLVKYTSALRGMSTKQRMILFNQAPFMVGWLKELGNIAESVCQFLNAVKERNKIPSNEKSEEV